MRQCHSAARRPWGVRSEKVRSLSPHCVCGRAVCAQYGGALSIFNDGANDGITFGDLTVINCNIRACSASGRYAVCIHLAPDASESPTPAGSILNALLK